MSEYIEKYEEAICKIETSIFQPNPIDLKNVYNYQQVKINKLQSEKTTLRNRAVGLIKRLHKKYCLVLKENRELKNELDRVRGIAEKLTGFYGDIGNWYETEISGVKRTKIYCAIGAEKDASFPDAIVQFYTGGKLARKCAKELKGE